MRILGNRLLLAPLPKAQKSDGGIFLLDQYNDDRMQWRVVQKGSKCTAEVEVGDMVLVSGYRGNVHEFDDGTILIGAEQIKSDLIASWTAE